MILNKLKDLLILIIAMILLILLMINEEVINKTMIGSIIQVMIVLVSVMLILKIIA